MDFSLQRIGFSDLPGWSDDDPGALIEALARCHRQIVSVKPHKTGHLSYESDGCRLSPDTALRMMSSSWRSLKGFDRRSRSARASGGSSE